MPNWCNNHIIISGDVEKMKPIYEFFLPFKDDKVRMNDVDTLVMNSLVPHDKEYEKIESTGNFILVPQDRFYGTKWDFSPHWMFPQDITNESISFSVETAWSPPEAFCKRLSKKYGVEVHIEFEEGGCDFAGFAHFNNGKQVEAKTYTFLEGMYYNNRDNFWEEVDNHAQTSIEDNESLSKFLENFPFVKDKNDIGELTEVYHIHKEDQN